MFRIHNINARDLFSSCVFEPFWEKKLSCIYALMIAFIFFEKALALSATFRKADVNCSDWLVTFRSAITTEEQ